METPCYRLARNLIPRLREKDTREREEEKELMNEVRATETILEREADGMKQGSRGSQDCEEEMP